MSAAAAKRMHMRSIMRDRARTLAQPLIKHGDDNDDDGVVNVNVIWPGARRVSCGDTEHNKSAHTPRTGAQHSASVLLLMDTRRPRR